MKKQSNPTSILTLLELVLPSMTALLLTLVASSAFAQSYRTEVEIIQEAIGLEKKVAVGNFMKLDKSAESFWKIYDEYEVKRKALGKERIEIIADYAQRYPTISDDEILALFKRREQMKKSMDKLQRSYFKRMSKEVGVSKAAQFWQLENYFNAIIQANVYSQIPFIGENIKDN